jgi:hypothetical protein
VPLSLKRMGLQSPQKKYQPLVFFPRIIVLQIQMDWSIRIKIIV